MSSLTERTLGARLPDRMRALQEVALILSDGTEIRGVLHRTQGTRTLDYLNHQAEAFVAMTDAMLFTGERTENVAFIAINKAHIVRVIEAAEEA
jgi:Family of unknown function (DUF6812)